MKTIYILITAVALLAWGFVPLKYEVGQSAKQTVHLHSISVKHLSGPIGMEEGVLNLAAQVVVDEVDEEGRVSLVSVHLDNIEGSGRLSPSFERGQVVAISKDEQDPTDAWMQRWKSAVLREAMNSPLRFEIDPCGFPSLIEESIPSQFHSFPLLLQFIRNGLGTYLLETQFAPVAEAVEKGDWITAEADEGGVHICLRWNRTQPLLFELDEVKLEEETEHYPGLIIHRQVSSSKTDAHRDAIERAVAIQSLTATP